MGECSGDCALNAPHGSGKESDRQSGDAQDSLDPWVGKIPWFAWKTPWTEEPGGLQLMGLQSRT